MQVTINRATLTGSPVFLCAAVFDINISIQRGQPRTDSIVTGKAHECGIAVNGCEVPDTTEEIATAEFPEIAVMYKEVSAPEIRRHNLQTIEVRNPSIRPRGGQKHICKCSCSHNNPLPKRTQQNKNFVAFEACLCYNTVIRADAVQL